MRVHKAAILAAFSGPSGSGPLATAAEGENEPALPMLNRRQRRALTTLMRRARKAQRPVMQVEGHGEARATDLD